MGSVTIGAIKNLVQGCVLYTTLIGQPSTGKTTAMSLVRDAVYEVEEAIGLNLKNSKLINSNLTFSVNLNSKFITTFFLIKVQQLSL